MLAGMVAHAVAAKRRAEARLRRTAPPRIDPAGIVAAVAGALVAIVAGLVLDHDAVAADGDGLEGADDAGDPVPSRSTVAPVTPSA